MSDETDWIKARLEARAWTVRHVLDPAVVVEGRAAPIVVLFAELGLYRARVVVARPEATERDFISEREAPAMAVGTMTDPPRRLRATVLDLERSGALLLLARDDDFDFGRTQAALARHGWSVDPALTSDDDYDAYGWQIRASTVDAYLDMDMRSGSTGLPIGLSLANASRASFTGSLLRASAAVTSRPHGEVLLDVLRGA